MVFFHQQTQASEDSNCTYHCVFADSWALGIGLGHGEYTNPLHQGDRDSFNLLPAFYFYADNFYIENLSLGYTLFENQQFAFDIVSELNQDGLYFQDRDITPFLLSENTRLFPLLPGGMLPETTPEITSPPNDVERHLSYLAGVSIDYYLHPNWTLSLSALTDVTAVHHGQQFETNITYYQQLDALSLSVSTGLTYLSDDIVDYYYGYNEFDFPEHELKYQGERAINHHIKVSTQYALTKNFSLVMQYSFEQLHSEIENSLLVKDGYRSVYFIGISGHIEGY
ncbi:MipA/OmpV family protein [Shewanella intestini]|uniref:MipA/OmpV family protein n=1 Tax=Shewanella intestini TaxID=2017544 RepID=A0ABS5I1N8_9GAMM|nr:MULTISPECIES: MipA/OmpV family protein [Shewanella]MBR9727929.1 MipA/OmpV family protein [Shewanella intestini]